MNKTCFSVALCVYGGDNAEWFSAAIESVINQSLIPDEIVIVVDGPISNALKKVISNYEENKLFKIIRLDKNYGHGIARNTAIQNCSYPLIALMDADDICISDRFEKQIDIFNSHPEVDIVGGNISEFFEKEENIVGKRIVPRTDTEIKKYLKKRCPMNQMTVMFRKDSVMCAGGYLSWFCNEDYYLWIRMALKGMIFYNLDYVLVNVRVNNNMYQRRGGMAYFVSEAVLQKFMLRNGIINIGRYFINIAERFVLQILMNNKMRSIIYKKFARGKVTPKKQKL